MHWRDPTFASVTGFSDSSAAFVLQVLCGNVERERAVPRQQLGALAGMRHGASRLVLHRVRSDNLLVPYGAGFLVAFAWMLVCCIYLKFLTRSQGFQKS